MESITESGLAGVSNYLKTRGGRVTSIEEAGYGRCASLRKAESGSLHLAVE